MENLGTYDSGVSFRKFIFLFLLVCVVAGVGVGYSAFSKTSVTVVPKSTIKEFSTEITVDGNSAYPDLDKGLLSGEVKLDESGGSKKVKEVVPKKIEEYARGKVIVHNTTPYVQMLRKGAPMKATGTSEGIVFNTVDKHKLSPKITKEVDVIASVKGIKGNIPPTKFEFINLTTKYMREHLWAESKEKMTGGVREAKIVIQEDLEREFDKLARSLFKQKLEELNSNLNEEQVITEESARFQYLDKQSTITAGTETEEYEIQVKIKIEGVIINEKDLKTIIRSKIEKMEESNEEFVDYEKDSFSYRLTDLNLDEKKAVIKVVMKGIFRSKLSPDIFNKKSIIGYNERALKEHFDRFDNIAGIEVSFWPPFRKTVPNLENRIDINVKTD